VSDATRSDQPATPPVSAVAPTPSDVYNVGDPSVIGAIAIFKPLPPWQPLPSETKMSFFGVLEIIVAEDGKVISASLLKSVHPRYDSQLLAATRSWKFRPATKNGVPVKFRYTMTVRLTTTGVGG
jgi:protein TonB